MLVLPKRTIRVRIAVAIALGAICATASWATTSNVVYHGQDFGIWWEAAHKLLAHEDPYLTMPRPDGILKGRPFNFPLTTPLLVIPFAPIRVEIAGPLFIGLSSSALAFAVTSRAWWPLWMFGSGAMMMILISAQISPLLTVGAVIPALGWVGAFKPNLGLAIWAARPSMKNAAIMLVIFAISVLVLPSWPREWISNAANSPFHFSPITTPGGILLLTAACKWRRPEARLLLVLAVVPSSPIVYEALLVFTVASTATEMGLFALLSSAMFLLMADQSLVYGHDAYMARARPAMLWLIYMPALIMVIRRPNEGVVPEWMEVRIARLPRWLRGQSTWSATQALVA